MRLAHLRPRSAAAPRSPGERRPPASQRGPVLVLVLALLFVSGRAHAQQAIYLVRHAEKVDESRDAALSPTGEARAVSLAHALGKAGVSAIFVTEFQRTKRTAAPLAAARHLTPIIIPAKALEHLVQEIRKRSGDSVLVVGHSDTLPQILAALGVAKPPAIARADHDDLFVVIPRPGAPPAFLHLAY